MAKRKTFEEWYKTVPKEKNDTSTYNLRRAYELAPQEQLDAFVNDPNAHLMSAYENEKGVYEFMKNKNHPTLNKELEWSFGDSDDAIEFRKRYALDTSGDNYRYVPKALYKGVDSFQNKEMQSKYGQKKGNVVKGTDPQYTYKIEQADKTRVKRPLLVAPKKSLFDVAKEAK